MDIKNTNLYKELVERKSRYIENIDKVYQQALEFLPKINRVFVNYTGHGVEHSLNVIKYMFDLVTNISKLSDLEIACLIYSALLHDVGMVVEEEEIKEIKSDKLICNGRKYSAIHEYIEDDLECLQECVRPVHGKRSYDFIMNNMNKELFLVPECTVCTFQEEVAEICQAHTMELEYVVKKLKDEVVKDDYKLNAQYVAMLLRIADYLDIDEKRAPIEVYRFLAPSGYSDAEWKQHYIISNRNKVESSIANRKKIVLYGKCENPKIHNKFLKYLDDVTREIRWWISYSKKVFKDIHWLLLEETIENKIETVGFEISDLKLNMDYSAIVNLLMGEKVYGNRKYGLRELIQNSLDACKVMREYAPQLERYKYDEYVPKIQVILDYSNNQLRVRDNGIGMSEEVLKEYFLNIGKSYYKSNDYVYQGNKYNPIGNFGIGFLACFMLSREVLVETKSFREEKGYALELYADSEYICKKECESFRNNFGTMISLNLTDALSIFDNSAEQVVLFIQKNFLNQDVDIYMDEISEEGKRLSKAVVLKSYEEIIAGKCILDKYLDKIEFAIDIRGELCPKNKLSQLDLLLYTNEIKFCRYDYVSKKLVESDMYYIELKKYLHNKELMLVKFTGVKKQYSNELQKIKELPGYSRFYDVPREWKEEIVFPISYNEKLLELLDESWSGNETIQWKNVLGKYIYNDVFLMNEDFKAIIDQSDFIDDISEISVEVGIVPLLEIGNERFIELKKEMNLRYSDKDASDVFLKGIRLEKARLDIDIDLAGIDLEEYIVNINRKGIIPNISRDNLSINDRKKIIEQLEYAVYMYILEQVEDKEMKDAIEIHIQEIS